jgi:hypothetical protein
MVYELCQILLLAHGGLNAGEFVGLGAWYQNVCL